MQFLVHRRAAIIVMARFYWIGFSCIGGDYSWKQQALTRQVLTACEHFLYIRDIVYWWKVTSSHLIASWRCEAKAIVNKNLDISLNGLRIRIWIFFLNGAAILGLIYCFCLCKLYEHGLYAFVSSISAQLWTWVHMDLRGDVFMLLQSCVQDFDWFLLCWFLG